MPKGGDTQLLQVVRRQALQETSSISFFAKLAHTAQGRRLGPCPGNFVQVPPSSDSSLDYEQALSPLEYRINANANAAVGRHSRLEHAPTGGACSTLAAS